MSLTLNEIFVTCLFQNNTQNTARRRKNKWPLGVETSWTSLKWLHRSAFSSSGSDLHDIREDFFFSPLCRSASVQTHLWDFWCECFSGGQKFWTLFFWQVYSKTWISLDCFFCTIVLSILPEQFNFCFFRPLKISQKCCPRCSLKVLVLGMGCCFFYFIIIFFLFKYTSSFLLAGQPQINIIITSLPVMNNFSLVFLFVFFCSHTWPKSFCFFCFFLQILKLGYFSDERVQMLK